jgi:hypothetical protein
MSLRTRAAAFTVLFASMLACARANADERERMRPSVALIGGYGQEMHVLAFGGPTSFGVAFGCRAGVTVAHGLYLGGAFIDHFGSISWAADATGASSYRASFHDLTIGPEIGRDFDVGAWLFRPYVGGGVLLGFGRTDVVNVVHWDNRSVVYVATGVLVARRIDGFTAGLDLRVTMPTTDLVETWAPTVLLSVGR